MITAIIRNKENTLVLELPHSIYDIYEKLRSIGIMQPPKQIPLTDNEDEDIGVKLFSESDFGQHLLLTLNEKNTIADANMLTLVIGAASEDIKEELEQQGVKCFEDSPEWTISRIRSILQNEKYCGDVLMQKTFRQDFINRKAIKNTGQLPMYLIENHHEGIVSREKYDAVQAEMARRNAAKSPSKNAVTGMASYASKYALSERLVCGECGTLYRRCTWTRNGEKRVVWRCVSRLDYGKKYCHNSPTLDEAPLQQAILAALNKAMADKALRVLAAAERLYDALPDRQEPEDLEQDLCFIGLAGMIDPVRPEVKAAIQQCRTAGIRPVMITGDHKDTAVAIGKELGIITDASQAVTGSALDSLTDEELDKAVEKYSVYARVQPEHKVRIVNAWRRKGAITAMTGDGVNDAPSIKSADIGVGMGITGTDVTKNVADMVLSDDNFATIVTAVEEGRRVYDNIRKSIQFLLSSNLAEVLTILVATLLGFTILEPVHLLWINLITDCFPALALGMERGEPEIMRRRPRDPKDGIFAGGMGFDVAWQGLLVTAVTLLAYFSGLLLTCPVQMDWAALVHITDPLAHKTGMTMAFFTLSMAEIFHSFNMRSRRASLFSMGQNGYLWGAMVLSLVLSTVVLYVPALAAAFDFVPLSGTAYGVSMALALAVIPVVELVKAVQRAVHR